MDQAFIYSSHPAELSACHSHHWSCSSVPNFALTSQPSPRSALLAGQQLLNSVPVKQYLLLNK